MPVVCPTITASTEDEYKAQVEKVAPFAHRLHIDLTDGIFAERRTVSPEEAWWPAGVAADFHLMYQEPLPAVQAILTHKPNLIVVQAEAHGDFQSVLALCREHKVKVGVALMPDTPAGRLQPVLAELDHVMIFSGNLGYQGGSQADLNLLAKARELKQQKPDIELGWDGGVSAQNVSQLVFGGIDVINAGGFIHSAPDAEQAYVSLQRIADETGTT